MPWFGGVRRWRRWRRALDIVGLALVHGLLGLFLTSALFGMFQQAFQGVALDLTSVTSNLTLLVTGVALLTVTEFLAHDLDHWAASALVSITVMFVEVRYLTMTAFEMGAAAIVYVWLLLFIRIVSAAADGAEEARAEDAQEHPGANGEDALAAPDGSMGP